MIRRLVYGKTKGLRLSILTHEGARIERIVTNLSPLELVPEGCHEIVLEGLIDPPISGVYTIYIEASRSPIIRFEDRLLPLRTIDQGRYLSAPIKMCSDALYRIEISYSCAEYGPIKRVDILREDGVVEPITHHTYSPLSNTITLLGLPPKSRVIAKCIGIVASAQSDERGIASMTLPDAKPPLSICIEIENREGTLSLGCLSDVWGGDVYQAMLSTKPFHRGGESHRAQ